MQKILILMNTNTNVVEIAFEMNNPALKIMYNAIDGTGCHILKSHIFKNILK